MTASYFLCYSLEPNVFSVSDEIACIGILARNTNVVYQKNINGFEDINYMKVFYNLENIGKIQEVKTDI